ncbi:hypothetical protein [Roseibium polysiphoniae]|nr:hypothetical protein [Roseibium polysiphoniae]
MRSILLSLVIGFSLSGCGSLQEGFELLSFQPDSASGVKDQVTEVFFYSVADGQQALNPKFSLSKGLPSIYMKYPAISQELRHCQASESRRQQRKAGEKFLSSTVIFSSLITYGVNELYSYVQTSISNYAKRLAEASQVTSTIRFAHSRPLNRRWRDVKCVLVTRRDKDESDVGLFLLYKKQNYGKASILLPRVFYANNSVAITEKGTVSKPAYIKVDVGVAVHAVTSTNTKNIVSEVGTVSLPTGKLVFGQPVINECTHTGGRPLCKNASALIAHPPAAASALSIGVKVVETGSSSNAADWATSANEALDGIAKPVLDEIVNAVTAQISG